MLSQSQLINCARRIVASGYTPSWNAACFQIVRWRKRRWAPVNASKVWYVRKPTPIDPEEWAELKRRYDNYRTVTRAIRKYLREELKQSQEQEKLDPYGGETDPEFIEGLEINRLWNEAIRPEREAWISQHDAENEEKRLELLIDIEGQKEAMKRLAEEQVQTAKVEAKSFISADDLDEAIEQALNTRVNYEFAIDLEGNRYYSTPGAHTDKSTHQEETPEKAESSS